MFFSIIINTHNQREYLIDRAIDSCLNQDFNSRLYEIILTDTSNKKFLQKKYSNKKIKIIETNILSPYPCIDQALSIKRAHKFTNGQNICFLDGDDFFSNNKLSVLYSNFKNNEKFINQDHMIGFNEKMKKNFLLKKNSIHKNSLIFKKFFNNWPKVNGTSSICISKKLLDNFFLKINFLRWKYLAIDALLIIYYQKYLNNFGEHLTFKSFHNNNLDGTFSNKFSRKFWKRRYLQHQYYQEINKKKYFNIDFLFSKLFS